MLIDFLGIMISATTRVPYQLNKKRLIASSKKKISRTEMSCRALFIAVSCLTWFRMAVLGLEELIFMEELPESMFVNCRSIFLAD